MRLLKYFIQFLSKQIYITGTWLSLPCVDKLTEEEFTELLGKPEVGYIRRSDGKDLGAGIPEYIVTPTVPHIGHSFGIKPSRSRQSTSGNRFYTL